MNNPKYDDYDYSPAEQILDAIHGNEKALHTIIHKYTSYMRGVLRNRAIRTGIDFCIFPFEDVEQTVWIKFIHDIKRFKILSYSSDEVEAMFDSYATKALRHNIRDVFNLFLKEADEYILIPYEDLDRLSEYSPDPFEYDMNQIKLGNTIILLKNDRLSLALKKLRKSFQRIIELSFFLGFSDTEISEIMNIRIASVYEYKHEAILQLRKILSEME